MSAAHDSTAAGHVMGDPSVPILDIPPNESLSLSDGAMAAAVAAGDAQQDLYVGVPSTAAAAAAEEQMKEESGAATTEEVVEAKLMDVDATTTNTTITRDEDVTVSVVATENVETVAPVATGAEEGKTSMQVDTATVSQEHGTVSVVATENVTKTVQEEVSSVVQPAAGDENKVETSVVTTTTVTLTETSVVVASDVPMGETLKLEGATSLGKRDEAEEPQVAVATEEGTTIAADAGAEEESAPPLKKAKVSDPTAVVDVQEAAAAPAVAEKGEKNGVDDVQREPVKLGPKTFHSAVEMFTYFYDLLHSWVSNVDVNKYEYLVLSDLISKGHRDADAKVGPGIRSFQIRFHPGWHSRCYYLIRTDGTVDDFSYRKCVDKIMPLPESLFSPSGDLLVEKLFGPEEDKWPKKGKARGNFGDGGGFQHGGKNSRGGGRRGGRGDRRGGRGGNWSR